MRRKWQEIFLGVAVVVLILIGARASGWIPAQAKYCEFNPYTEHEKCSVEQIATVAISYIGWFLNFISPAATWIATAVIGAYTIVLARVTGRQARLTRESIDLARAEFISSHRPRIIVYGLALFGAAAEGKDPTEPLRVSFRYVNSGDTPAKVKMIGTKLVHLFKATMPSEIEFKIEKIDPPVEIESGRHGFRLTADRFDQERFLFSSTADNYSLVCVGVIVYADDNDTDRQMGFCRRYDQASNRWLAMDDTEYEYSY